MKKTVLFAIVLHSNFMVLSQSLFSNGGFENYYGCPTSTDMSAWAINVVGKTDSPDFYNCSFFPSEAYSGTGSMYLGAVKYTNSITREGIVMAMNQSMELGATYVLSLNAKYGYKYPNAGFNPNLLNGCYKLGVKFLTSATIPAYPMSYDYQFDPEATVGNSNAPSYHPYQCNFTASQAYTHLFIQTIPTNKCMSNASECMMTVFYNTIDNLSLTKLTALDVGLKSFNISHTNNIVSFDWETNTERNNDFFTLLHSSDGLEWKTLQTIASKGNSNEVQGYHWSQNFNSKGLHYFRLQQTDSDGSNSVLSEKSLFIATNDVMVYPNPAHDILNIQWDNPTVSVQKISLSDPLGNLVLAQEVDVIESQLNLTLHHLKQGFYTLFIQLETGELKVFRILIH